MAVRKVCIGDFLNKSQNWVEPEPDQTYKQITARLWGKGLTLRAEVAGSRIAAARQLRVKAGQFLVSRIDARHGAFGIVPPSLDGALVSNDFPCFDIDSKVVFPTYFAWYARTENFIALCRRASEGSTNRVRLKESEFLRMTIPLPPLDEQRRVVVKLDKVEALVGEATSIQTSVKNERKALLINMAHRPDLSTAEKKERGWREVKLKEILTPAAEPYDVDPETSYPNLGIYSFARGAFTKPPIDGASTSAKTLYRVQKGQFIYSRLFAFEGAYTIVPAELDGRFVSNEFPSFDTAEEAATPEFLAAFFMNPRTWTNLQAGSLGLGSRRQRVNQKHLLEYTIWLPPLAWQRRIGEVFEKFKSGVEAEGSAINTFMPTVLHGVFNGEVHNS